MGANKKEEERKRRRKEEGKEKEEIEEGNRLKTTIRYRGNMGYKETNSKCFAN